MKENLWIPKALCDNDNDEGNDSASRASYLPGLRLQSALLQAPMPCRVLTMPGHKLEYKNCEAYGFDSS